MFTVFVPLRRMPLNPNGKIDKPALPFPDTAQAAAASDQPASSAPVRKLTPTEQTIHDIWRRLLPASPPSIPLDENFVDLGGHSILATRLIFELRKAFVVDAPLGLVFDCPTIGQQAVEIDGLKQSDFGLARDSVQSGSVLPSNTLAATASDTYAKDFSDLVPTLSQSYSSVPSNFKTRKLVIFLTGATGFLGAFVLQRLLRQVDRISKVICLVRAPDATQGLDRLRAACQDRAIWQEEWVSEGRLSVVQGDLGIANFGLDEKTWDELSTEADVVLHNGAMVRYPSEYRHGSARSLTSKLVPTAGALDL